MQARPITPRITVADQPDESDLKSLAAEGYVGVVNLREPGEPDQPLQPAAEGEHVRALGLDYLHQPVGGAPLTEETVGSVLRFLDDHDPGKILLHCRKGGRAVALVLLHQARANGWSPAETFDKGREMGLNVEGKLREKVETYLAQKTSS
jgi:uncharacterized protein (TIGR01244 family)